MLHSKLSSDPSPEEGLASLREFVGANEDGWGEANLHTNRYGKVRIITLPSEGVIFLNDGARQMRFQVKSPNSDEASVSRYKIRTPYNTIMRILGEEMEIEKEEQRNELEDLVIPRLYGDSSKVQEIRRALKALH